MLTLTYEFKLIPSTEQITIIENILAVCIKVWNYALRERKDWINSRKCAVNCCSLQQEYIIPANAAYPGYKQQAAALTQAKKSNPELKRTNAQVLQQVLRTLDRAFKDMKTQGYGFPRFKNKYRMRSFVFPQFSSNPVKDDWIKLPMIGLVQMRLSRPIPEGFNLKQVRVVRRASGYFVMLALQSDVSVPDNPPSGHPLGIDVGLDKFLATSDNELIERPRFLSELHGKLKLTSDPAPSHGAWERASLLQRRLKLKVKGSANRHKLNQKIARIHQKISDTRKDFHLKLAHHLCDQAGMIFVEDLDFRAWAKGMLGKHTLDAGFGRSSPGCKLRELLRLRQFFNILAWVCSKRGVYFGKVDYKYTSQICPNCGAYTGKKNLSERIHKCSQCQYEINRDVASAKVICNRGVTGVRAVGQIVE